MHRHIVALTLFALICAATSARALPFTVDLLPAASIAAPPGAAAGWGYRIENTTSYWLELANVFSDPFLRGTPTLLFDFPILAPGEVRSIAWQTGVAGLFEFLWNVSAPVGSVNTGAFTIEGNLWSADPLRDATAVMIGAADPASAPYAVSAVAAAVPEPSLLALYGCGASLLVRRFTRSARSR